jgi:2-succinyl-5-enolpyruvyl-6-hydroxy-3-cyclohexene-1-carboxylate synthase
MSHSADTHIMLRAFVNELVRCGVRHACTSPGSRSTPLVLALVRDGGLRAHSHVDERSAAFFALGAAKASRVPTVLACTSGTAAANYAPAVIEAYESGVPLVVLTADRPPELRQVGAGQTIDQLKLYGSAAKWFFEVGTHEATPDRLRWMRQLACRAVWTSLDGRPGPVHLNFAFREPLVLSEELPADEPGGGGRPGRRPWTSRTPARRDPAPLGEWLQGRRYGVLVAGTGAASARPLAEALGWPLLADPLSGARHGSAAIAHYDALLRDEPWAASVAPEAVLRVGDLPTSKPLRQWLRRVQGPQAAVFPPGTWPDPDATLSDVFAVDAADLTELAERVWERDASWLGTWRAADAAAAKALRAVLDDELSEPAVAREVVAAMPSGGRLVVAASMPVRDVETFAPPRDVEVLANRGANGIDGTTSTAYGVAAATGAPTVLLVGDVTLAHDLGGLLAGPRLGVPLTIVVIDNAGGGIFDFLAVASQQDAFEEHVATPTGLDIERIAALFGAAYAPVADLDGLREALAGAIGSAATTLVHVRTVRQDNVTLHRRCWDAVAAARRPASDS